MTVKDRGSAITVFPAAETIAISNNINQLERIVPRQSCLLARAPQVFYYRDIFNAHIRAKIEEKSYIDSASMLLDQGFKLHTVEGPAENIKITTQYDLMLCKLLIKGHE